MKDKLRVRNLLAQNMDKLATFGRDGDMMIYRHGLLDGQSHTLQETGDKWNRTRERVRQIEALTLDKIKNRHGN